MCSHRIYNKNEISKLIKTVNKLIYDQVTSLIGLKNTNEEEAGNDNSNDENEFNIKNSITYFLYVINMWFFDSSYDLSLFATDDSDLTAGTVLQAANLKIISYIDDNAMSLNKSLNIINYISQSRIHQSVTKFLKYTSTEFKNSFNLEKSLKSQILLQMGIMPKQY
jgi:hypothetical protein